MKLRRTHPPLPTHDYSLALQDAVSWLGDRYLLATPIKAAGRLWRTRRAPLPWYLSAGPHFGAPERRNRLG
jgi:hypothetical protein